jgi:hypothetical protein
MEDMVAEGILRVDRMDEKARKVSGWAGANNEEACFMTSKAEDAAGALLLSADR